VWESASVPFIALGATEGALALLAADLGLVAMVIQMQRADIRQ
jgi:hypothetical protein